MKNEKDSTGHDIILRIIYYVIASIVVGITYKIFGFEKTMLIGLIWLIADHSYIDSKIKNLKDLIR